MISIILFCISVFCFLYYGVIIGYSGVRTSFLVFWPSCAMITAFLALFLQSNFYHMLPSLLLLIVKLFFILIFAFFLILFLKILLIKENPVEEADYIIVLGAIVRGTQPSLSLQRRIDVTYDYLSRFPSCTAILSGYQNPNAMISQAACMQQNLCEMDIPSYRLLMEPNSRTTLENFQFSKELITKKSATIAVVTNDFHLYRALKIARSCGYKNIIGIKAKTPTPLLLHCYVRELFANIKHLFH